MYIVDNQITVTWILEPTATPLLATDFDIKFKTAGLAVTYTDDGIVNYVAPTAACAGSIQYLFTPDTAGHWELTLACLSAASYTIKDKKDFWIFCAAPTTQPATEVLTAPSIIPIACP